MGKRYARQAGNDQSQSWKRALAEHNRSKRNQRGRRPSPPITGVRIPPPSDNPERTTP